MSRTVRFLGRSIDAADEVADIMCSSASAVVPPSRRDVGPSGDIQISISPTAIVLHDVEPESMAVLRKDTWTHVHGWDLIGEPSRDFPIWRIFFEGENVRVLV